MKVGKNQFLYGLVDYNLTLKQFLRLANTKVKIDLDLLWPNEKRFYYYKPEARKERIDRDLQNKFTKLTRILKNIKYELKGTAKRPRGVSIEIYPKSLNLFLNKKIISDIWVREIQGLKKNIKDREQNIYAVKARYAIQFEGIKSGLQTVEENIILIKAFNCKDAEKKYLKNIKYYEGEPTLNTNNILFRWKFEKILDICESLEFFDCELNDEGNEIYYNWKDRRMKPEYEWHPIKKYKI